MREEMSRADADDAAHTSLPEDALKSTGDAPDQVGVIGKAYELRQLKQRLLRKGSRRANGEPEAALLAQMTTADGIAEVIESGLKSTVFEDPLRQAVFNFALDYWDKHELVPSVKVIVDQYPGLQLELPDNDDGATGWLIERLARRHQTNRLQNLIMDATKTMHSDPLEAVAEMHRACTRVLEEAPRSGGVGIYVNIGAMFDEGLPEPPAPQVLRRTDGVPLFYPGEVNLIFGDPEHGKSWVALAACAQALQEDGRVLIADLDHNGEAAIVSRLLLLGAPKEALRDRNRFRLCEPDDVGQIEQMIRDCGTWSVDVVVVDSTGELLPMFGASSDSADDFTGVHRRVLQPLADIGAAVLLIDHLAKGKESRQLGPTGSIAKRRAIGGLSVRVVRLRPFTVGGGGSARLLVNKDRHGGVRTHCAPTRSGSGSADEQLIGTFGLDVDADGVFTWDVAPPETVDSPTTDPTEFRPTALMERASMLIEQNPGALTRNGIAEQTGGRKATALWAVDLLAREGYLTRSKERYPRCTSTNPYRQVNDPHSDHYSSGNDHRGQISESDTDQ